MEKGREKKISDLIYWPDPRLSERCDEVPKGMDVTEIVATMRRVIQEERGLGLAAPQVGEMLRIMICDGVLMINPTIKSTSKKMRWVNEGCLSFPETHNTRFPSKAKPVRVRRHKIISMRAFDIDWNMITIKGRDWRGACMQHELDHLNGITLADHRST